MRARSDDTDPAAEEVQFALMRRATVGRRIRLAFSLSETVIGLSRRAIRRSLSEPTDEQVGLRFVELHYGRDLAEALQRYRLSRRR